MNETYTVGYMGMTQMSRKLLEVQNLSVRYPILSGTVFKRTVGHIYAVDSISFTLEEGDILGLVGESGCGKSSAARSLVKLVPAHSGSVFWKGTDILPLSFREMLPIRKEIQMIFQDPYSSLDPRMTAGSIIAEPLHIYNKRAQASMSGSEIRSRVKELMTMVGLSPHYENRYPHEFSGGQRQRIGIARALSLDPTLLVADEAVSALDVSIQAQIINLLRKLQEDFKLTYIFIAHDLAVVRYITNRVAVMYLGRIVEEGDTEELFNNPLHPYTRALLSSVPVPDPKLESKRKRIPLEGEVPSPNKLHKGCVFYERCANRMERCKNEKPYRARMTDNHKVACFLHHSRVDFSNSE